MTYREEMKFQLCLPATHPVPSTSNGSDSDINQNTPGTSGDVIQTASPSDPSGDATHSNKDSVDNIQANKDSVYSIHVMQTGVTDG